jgi:hypothetical protein
VRSVEHERTRSEECPLTRCKSFALRVCGLQDLTGQGGEVRHGGHMAKSVWSHRWTGKGSTQLGNLYVSDNMERIFGEMMKEKSLLVQSV